MYQENERNTMSIQDFMAQGLPWHFSKQVSTRMVLLSLFYTIKSFTAITNNKVSLFSLSMDHIEPLYLYKIISSKSSTKARSFSTVYIHFLLGFPLQFLIQASYVNPIFLIGICRSPLNLYTNLTSYFPCMAPVQPPIQSSIPISVTLLFLTYFNTLLPNIQCHIQLSWSYHSPK